MDPTVKKIVYQVLAGVFGIVLIAVGVGALFGANFAHGYVDRQLSQERITMPGEPAMGSVSPESAEILEQFWGDPMTTGPQAQAYANNFIYDHMLNACADVTDANGNPVDPVPPEQCTYAGIGGAVTAATDAGDANAAEAYQALRTSNFQGSALRSMLLTAYAFWLVGAIAQWVGIAAIVVGVLLLVLRFTVLRGEADPVSVDANRAPEATPRTA